MTKYQSQERRRSFVIPELLMQPELKARTFNFAVRIIRMASALPRNRIGEIIARQILRCGTSVGANSRGACLAKSRKDFISKLKIVEEESDETIYWLELILAINLVPAARLESLLDEANQILRIIVASIKTARRAKKTV